MTPHFHSLVRTVSAALFNPFVPTCPLKQVPHSAYGPDTFLMVQFGSGLAQGHTLMTVVSGVGLVVSFVPRGLLGRRVYKEINATLPTTEPPEAVSSPPLLPRGKSPCRARKGCRPRHEFLARFASIMGFLNPAACCPIDGGLLCAR